MVDPPPRARVRGPHTVLAPLTHFLARGAAALVLALWLLGIGASPAAAGAIIYGDGVLVFTNQLDSDPDRSVDVKFTESEGRLVIFSADDVLAFSPGAPCEDVRLYDTVACDLSAITLLAATLGAGADRVSVESALEVVLCGGPGNDTLSAGSGEGDLVAGAGGDDRLSGGAGNDILRADRIVNAADATCTETPGSPPGANTLDGGLGDDLLVGDAGGDTLAGEAGDDYVFGRPGDDHIDGGAGDDALVGLDGTDTLDGGAGFDVLSGGSGPDHLIGGDDRDHLGLPMLLVVDGGPVEASLEVGHDRMEGSSGDDTLFAGPGDRTLNYPSELQQRAGGRGEPNGADVLSGGPGTDQVSYVNREIPVTVTLDGRPDDGSVGEGDDISSDVEHITGGTSDDVIEGGPANDVLDGGPGSDVLRGLGGADALDGGPVDGGADVLAGGAGPDSLVGGPGPDRLGGEDGDDSLSGGGGADRLEGGTGADGLQGEADGDDLAPGPGADVLDGGPGVDRVDYADAVDAVTVTLDGVRNDGERGEDWVRQTENVRGGAGADSLFGDAGVNTIEAGLGDDLIDAAAGADSVSAGRGRDAVLARDDVRDSIACGAGRDVGVVDELDVLSRRAESCERADRGGGARRGEALLRPACRLDVRLPGAARVLPLRQTLSVPRGTRIDAGRCGAKLSAGRRAPRVRADGGALVLRRAGTRRRALALALAGPSFSTCRGAPTSRRVRTLEVRAHGRVRLAGRYAATAGVGASWNVEDRCGSTVTRVRRGKVSVTDRARRRAVVVRAPDVYISKPRRDG